ncbi:HpcH/HpaI aldolase family protein [Piscinibacter sakaiensis]|uniref:2,4-dihydroxyhept-2-ene-1,7-dioic acid aldolase n=1 Tax=Piscinibacter sakaiensis TaxID=1547922 RepID=A0A0K8P632_PISS1|nr:aldolase/citrate lyase family protein [Piscinibacter sakaiensis]GAP38062.1 2,4-dihydroxyhept-2-ene-1,7-dioic acid aldolase [Piscinibacter sakaiensis]
MIPRINRIQEKRARGETPLGVIVQTGSPDNVEMAGANGLDFVILDCEHGSLAFDRVTEMLRAADGCGITPLVRVPDQTPHHVLRALDAGAMGVVVPNVRSAAQAREITSAAKYRDASGFGSRGACPSTRANGHLARDWEAFARWSNAHTQVWLLIESAEGVEQIDAILDVPGIAAIVPGPFDLAQSMGHGADMRHPEVVAALRRMVGAAARRGIDSVAVLLATSSDALREEAAFWREMGVSIFWVGGDRRMMSLAMARRREDVEASLRALTR